MHGQTMFWLPVILHYPGTTNMWLIYEHGIQILSLIHVVYHNTVSLLSLQGALHFDTSYNCFFCFPLFKVVPL